MTKPSTKAEGRIPVTGSSCMMSFHQRIGWVLLSIVLVSLPSGVWSDSLLTEHANAALLISRDVPWALEKSASDESHPLGVQILFVEKQERKSQQTVRWVNVYQYDYDTRKARRLSIDLQSNSVIDTSTILSPHLPLNDAEISFAKLLIENDGQLVESLKEDQISRGESPFTTFDELDLKASIYEPMDSQHSCTQQRCVLVSLFDHTRTVLRVEPIVNLNTLAIEQLGSR